MDCLIAGLDCIEERYPGSLSLFLSSILELPVWETPGLCLHVPPPPHGPQPQPHRLSSHTKNPLSTWSYYFLFLPRSHPLTLIQSEYPHGLWNFHCKRPILLNTSHIHINVLKIFSNFTRSAQYGISQKRMKTSCPVFRWNDWYELCKDTNPVNTIFSLSLGAFRWFDWILASKLGSLFYFYANF